MNHQENVNKWSKETAIPSNQNPKWTMVWESFFLLCCFPGGVRLKLELI